MRRDLLDSVVRRFLDDLHVMHMRFAHARRRDLDELAARSQLIDRATTAIAHRRAQSAHQLVDDIEKRPFVWNATFDAFGNELLGGGDRVFLLELLEVAIRAALLHRGEASHAAVALVRATLIELDLAG